MVTINEFSTNYNEIAISRKCKYLHKWKIFTTTDATMVFAQASVLESRRTQAFCLLASGPLRNIARAVQVYLPCRSNVENRSRQLLGIGWNRNKSNVNVA